MKNQLLNKSIIFLFLMTSYSFSFGQTMPNFSGTPTTAGCNTTIATWTPSTGHIMEFKGVIYDYPVSGQSTWLYEVSTSTVKKAKAISHTSFPINLTCVNIVNNSGLMVGKYTYSNGTYGFNKGAGSPELINPDPKTGIVGLKFDEGFDNQSTANYFYVLSSKPDITSTTAAVKAGNEIYYATVCGPDVFAKVPLSITGINSHYNTNDAVVSFTVNPSSAIVSGNGISGSTFNPQTAGGGTTIINIQYTLHGGCGVQNDTIQVHIDCAPKPITIIGLDTLYHMFDKLPISLTANPSGGTFSGAGIDELNSTFTPYAAKIGTHLITYTYGLGNCSWDTTTEVDVSCCVVEVSNNLPANVELQTTKPSNYQPVIIKAYPLGGQFVTTSAGLTVISTKADSAKAEFDAYVAGPGKHIIEYISVDNGDTCSTVNEITVTEDDSSPLAVELLEFKANIQDDVVHLEWKTASETNNDLFTIEKSLDYINWIEVGTTQGAGNSNIENYYELFDYTPAEGMNYYKLTQTDFDGTREVFELVYINFQNISKNLIVKEVYPNPASDVINLKLKSDTDLGQVTIEVIDLFGRTVIKQFVELSSFEIISSVTLNNIEKGFYFLNVYSKNEKPVTIKFMKE
ncbi:MAG: T9SS type A sorting domain-containing protein [Saprospiraceae bacterium]|nr:T9SS type A sorting domain-containing protein [Saprospiraceae bacterium]